MAKIPLNTNSKRAPLTYTGKEEYQPKPGDIDNETEEILYPYIPVSKGLVEAVNLSINLNRPLLLEGEPGCGKTRLARAVAYEFGKRYGELYNVKKWPYADWNIKSSDQARDGLYIYDAVRRLFDVQLFTAEHQLQNINSTNVLERNKIRRRLEDPKHEAYIQCGSLGKAFQASQQGQRMIVLIDEIDKADTDFPNDLLLELEEKRFFIKETGSEIRAKPDFTPIIFITSNGQRKLPDAFLRRCLYHYIEFPKKEDLIKVVQAHFDEKTLSEELSEELIDKIVARFIKIRNLLENEKGYLGKKVSTSELIDWVKALRLEYKTKAKIERVLLGKTLPCSSVLLKSQDDLEIAELREQEDSDSE